MLMMNVIDAARGRSFEEYIYDSDGRSGKSHSGRCFQIRAAR